MTRYALALSIRYRFALPTAGTAREVLRIRPTDLPGRQRVLACAVTVEPKPLERVDFVDFFGTKTLGLVLPGGLSELVIGMRAEVECLPGEPGLDLSVPVAGMAAELAGQTDLGKLSPHHFLAPSRRIPLLPEITRYAARAVPQGATVRAAVAALGRALHRDIRFDPGATTVDTPIAEAFARRHGVCQDMAQVMIAGLRGLGVPAAYVSGYLRTLPPPGQARLAGADAMHAWVRAWAGAREGWIDFDPTNCCFAGTDHVVIGHGRDYADAAPVVGSLRLEGGQSGGHSVDLVEI
jgi:transglutaminase-like putative cysteine protease